MGRYGLSCRWSEGRHQRHAGMNNIIYRVLAAAGVSARLEPPGLLRCDDKQPNSISVVPWWSGKFLVWDATCVDTFAASYRSQTAHAAGAAVATRAEILKDKKYSDLLHTHKFVPVAIESSGVFGPQSLSFVKELGRRIRYQTREKAVAYPIQRLSIAVQQGNVVSILGALDSQHCY